MNQSNHLNQTPDSSPNVYVGMKLYQHSRSRYTGEEIKEYTVKSISRKYFEVEETYRKFNKETLRYEDKNYSQANIQLHRSKQDILDKIESVNLKDKIRAHFNNYSHRDTLEQLREIAIILKLIKPVIISGETIEGQTVLIAEEIKSL